MRVHKPSADYVSKAAKKAKEDAKRSGRGDFYEWKAGENVLRLMPPWDAKGHVFKEVMSHFEIPPKREIVRCLATWPDEYDDCPICEKIKKVNRVLPAVDTDRIAMTTHYYANVIDRDEEEAGPLVCRFPPSVFNWVMTQMDNPKIGNITDIDNGFDLIITKSEKRGKRGKFIKYDTSFVPKPATLTDDEEELEGWIDNMANLDMLFSEPGDDALADIDGQAAAMFNYFLRKYRDEDGGDTDERPRRRSRRSRDDDDDDKPKRSRRSKDDDDEDEKPKRDRSKDDDDEDEKPKRRRSRGDDDDADDKPKRRRSRSDDDDEDEKPKRSRRNARDDDDDEDEKPKRRRASRDDDDEDEKPRRRSKVSRGDDDDTVVPSDDEDDKPKRRGKVSSVKDVDPKSVPPCFAGLDEPEEHKDGTIGFNEDLEKCLLCKHEVACLDAKRDKGQ